MARYIWCTTRKEMIPRDQYLAEKYEDVNKSHMVIGDIQPYKSMIDGSMITSRSKHRAHLKSHNCIEIGNETKHLQPFGRYEPPAGLKADIISVVNNQLYKRK